MQSKWLTKGPMACLFGHETPMASNSLRVLRSGLLASFVVIACLATARADDLLNKTVPFHIAASPLASALIEFSTQSGIQVAAADSDVAHLSTRGVNGAMPVGTALNTLLRGTGMEFARVGDATVAIRSPAAGLPASGLVSADASGTPTRETDAATIAEPLPPSAQELAGDSLNVFVGHHATTHFINKGTTPNLSRWRGGLQSICPITEGLTPAYNAFVTARLRAIAAHVGAPVQADPQCKSNVQILFTNKPQEKMDAVVKWATGPAFRNRYAGGSKDLIAFTSDHAVQGWYLTTSSGALVLTNDVSLVRLNVLPLWPRITQNYNPNDNIGTRLGGGSGSGIGFVILVVDQTKVVGLNIGAIADYLAMLALSVDQSPDHCDLLPSILDLMSSSCGARGKPTAMTAGDLAFLKALYYKNTGLGPSISGSDINVNMLRQFNLR